MESRWQLELRCLGRRRPCRAKVVLEEELYIIEIHEQS